MLKKYKPNEIIEFRPVYFNSATKTVINYKFSLDIAFQEILYRIDNWINGRSGCIVELIESQYIKISTYKPLSGSSYVKLPVKLKSPPKGLINIKNKDQKCFLWCHVRHINSVKINPERITREDKKLANDLDYDEIEFPVREENFSKIEKSLHNVFCYENKLVFSKYVSDQESEKLLDLLLVINENKSHYLYIKDLNRFMFHKTKNNTKKHFAVVCSVLAVKMC